MIIPIVIATATVVTIFVLGKKLLKLISSRRKRNAEQLNPNMSEFELKNEFKDRITSAIKEGFKKPQTALITIYRDRAETEVTTELGLTIKSEDLVGYHDEIASSVKSKKMPIIIIGYAGTSHNAVIGSTQDASDSILTMKAYPDHLNQISPEAIADIAVSGIKLAAQGDKAKLNDTWRDKVE